VCPGAADSGLLGCPVSSSIYLNGGVGAAAHARRLWTGGYGHDRSGTEARLRISVFLMLTMQREEIGHGQVGSVFWITEARVILQKSQPAKIETVGAVWKRALGRVFRLNSSWARGDRAHTLIAVSGRNGTA